MTFNVRKENAEVFKAEKAPELSIKIDTVLAKETLDKLEDIDKSEWYFALSETLSGKYELLTDIVEKVYSQNDNKLKMHTANILTLMLNEIVCSKIENEIQKIKIENFDFKMIEGSIYEEEDYDEEYDYDPNQDPNDYYKQIKFFNSRTVDALTEMETLREIVKNLVSKIDCKVLSDLLFSDISNQGASIKDRPLVSDKNAFTQSVLNLQKIAILKRSTEEFEYIKKAGLKNSALLATNTRLQNQIFSNTGYFVATNYDKLTLPLKIKESFKAKMEEDSNQRIANMLSNLQTGKFKGKDKNERLVESFSIYDRTIVSDYFYNLFLQNSYLNMPQTPVKLNYDLMNLKSAIKNSVIEASLEDFKNPNALFLFGNSTVKNLLNTSMIKPALDLDFVNKTKSAMVNSKSLALYDLMLEDSLYSTLFEPEDLFREVSQKLLLTEPLYKTDYNGEIIRPNEEKDLPLYFFECMIDMFEGKIGLEKIKDVFVAIQRERNIGESTEDEYDYLKCNDYLIDDLTNKIIRSRYLRQEFDKRNEGQIKSVMKRKKI